MPGSMSRKPLQHYQHQIRQMRQRGGIQRQTKVGPYILSPDGGVSWAGWDSEGDDTPGHYPEGRAAGSLEGPGEPLRGRRIGAIEAANKIYVLNTFGSIAAGGTSAGQSLTWQQSGLVLAMGLSVLGAAGLAGSAQGYAALAVQIHVSGNPDEDLFVNGNNATPDYADFASLVGTQGTKLFILERFVTVSEVWTFTCKNNDSASAFQPRIAMHFRRDPYGVRRVDP
jgi:hypothetical protein